MSEARAASMGKIKASIDGFEFDLPQDAINQLADEDMQLDAAAAVQSNKDLLDAQRLEQAKVKTEADILRLEQAKKKASSDAVKEELAQEQQNIRDAQVQKEKEQLEKDQQSAADHVKGFAADKANGVKDWAGNLATRVTDVGKQAWDSLALVSTPGTIFLPVTILFVFFLLIVRVNGHSRMEWLWLTLTWNAHMSGDTLNAGGGPDTPTVDTSTPSGPSSDAFNATIAIAPTSLLSGNGNTFTGPSTEAL